MTTIPSTLHPEHPPLIRRRLSLSLEHWAGLLLLLSIPLLAVFGLLGDKEATMEVSGGSFLLKASVPVIVREGETVRIRASLVALEGAEARPVAFFVSRAYLDRFDHVESAPKPAAMTDVEARIPLSAGDEPGLWEASLEAAPFRKGKALGALGVLFSDGSRMSLPLKTFVLP